MFAAGTPTGCKDRNGHMVCLGDHVRYRLEGAHTKPEYWNPEYEVIFIAPSFTLKHIGGGKDGGNHDFKLRCGGGNGDLEIIKRPTDLDETVKEVQRRLDAFHSPSFDREIVEKLMAGLRSLSEANAALKVEQDAQYDENVNRIAAEGAAILRAETAEAEIERLKGVLTDAKCFVDAHYEPAIDSDFALKTKIDTALTASQAEAAEQLSHDLEGGDDERA